MITVAVLSSSFYENQIFILSIAFNCLPFKFLSVVFFVVILFYVFLLFKLKNGRL